MVSLIATDQSCKLQEWVKYNSFDPTPITNLPTLYRVESLEIGLDKLCRQNFEHNSLLAAVNILPA